MSDKVSSYSNLFTGHLLTGYHFTGDTEYDTSMAY